MSSEERKRVSPIQAAILVIVGIGIIIIGLQVVEAKTPIILMFDGVVIMAISALWGIKFSDMQEDIKKTLSSMLVPILIIISVGLLVGSWMISGTVPIMIWAGMKILSPGIFLVATCIVCTLMSVMAGTSWGTISTVGVAFMGVSQGLGVPLEYTAGAVAVGAIFGDKLSPLSDSTVLAAAVSDIEIFDGIKHTVKSTLPAYLVSLIMYAVLGLKFSGGNIANEQYSLILDTLETTFNLNPILLLPPVLVFGLILLKKPTLPVFTLGILSACVLAVFVQGESVTAVANALNSGYTSTTDIPMMDSMLQRGGLNSMMGTVAILIAGGVFGAPLKTAGVVDIILEKITKIAKKGSVMGAGVWLLHGIFFTITGSYYVSYSVVGPMVKELFDSYGLARRNLARIMLDTGTGFAPVVPWSVTGAFVARTLGVETMSYMPYAPMLWLAAIISLVYIITGFTYDKVDGSGKQSKTTTA